MNARLPPISVIDVRDGGPLRHAREKAAEARALRDACLAFFPRAMLPALPLLDRAARRWLTRSRSPYVEEVGEVADTLGFPGVWLLNASYQWACTALAREEGGAPWLVRTLDWPFQGLGRHAEVARMSGAGGEFFSVTWPGYVGALTAMAPFRFAASINQAPMRRRTAHPWLRLGDFALNGVATWACRGRMPPDQLLRHVFERCGNYRDARRMLETVPVARPVIFTLIGCADGECCVIERTETGYTTREDNTSAANDWVPERAAWEGRIGTRRFLDQLVRRGRGLQPRPPRVAVRLARLVGCARFRVGSPAGAQSVHASRRRHVPCGRHSPSRRLRRHRCRTAGAGDAAVRDRRRGSRDVAAGLMQPLRITRQANARRRH